MKKYYCKKCGLASTNLASLLGMSCPKQTSGSPIGCHTLYEGGEKAEYTCKYCGQKARSIALLTGMHCIKNISIAGKMAYHEPAL